MWHLLCTHKRKRGLGSPELGPRTRTHSACPHYPGSSPLDPGPPYTSRKPIRPKLQRSQPTPRETIIPWDQQLKPSQEWSATTNCQGKAPRSPDCLCKVEPSKDRAIQGQSTPTPHPSRLWQLHPRLPSAALDPRLLREDESVKNTCGSKTRGIYL